MSTQQITSQPFRWQYDGFDEGDFRIRGRTLFFVVVLFSVILVATFLFIYTRWICRVSPPPPPSSSSTNHLAQDPPPPRGGLDLATINNMPIVVYRSLAAAAGNFSEAECCICLGIFGDKEIVKVMPDCRHWFHSECVDKWLAAQSSCPICRAPLRVDSPV